MSTPAQTLDTTSDNLLAGLLKRRSVSPKRLGLPGPTREQLADIVRVGLRAPDHGSLVPWRVIEFPASQRSVLAELFASEKQRRDPLVSAQDLDRARAHATNAPLLLAFVVCLRQNVTVPQHEQWLSAGAALGNMLNALDALGFGAVVLSGDRCSDTILARNLGIPAHERLVGFVSAGTVLKTPPLRQPQDPECCWSTWCGVPTELPRITG